MSAESGKGKAVDLKKAMDSASRLRWAAAHSTQLVRAAEEFDAACEVVAALVEALKPFAVPSVAGLPEDYASDGTSYQFPPKSITVGDLRRVIAALRAAGVATFGGLEESL